jgi:hypothetical protein
MLHPVQPMYGVDNHRSRNSASTSSYENPRWYFVIGATDHLTSDLERLHVHERYGGKDKVKVSRWCRFVYFIYWSFYSSRFISKILEYPTYPAVVDITMMSRSARKACPADVGVDR